jgi:arylsulfatase A-like enzyme
MPRLKNCCLLALAAFFLASSAGSALAAAPSRPNIILVMADDMGFSDIACYGGEIKTPTLDRLADGGIRFTQFYNTGRCCPTRAALLTGLYSHQAGVGHMVEDRGVPGYRGFLNDRCATIAEVLGDAGYATLMTGKWHLGENRPHWPFDRGFQKSYSLVSGGTNYFRLDPGRKLARDDQQISPEEGWYVTDAISDNAAAYLSEQRPAEKPFFLYVAYTAPHWPLHARPEDIARYRGKYTKGWDAIRRERHARMISLGLVDGRWPITPRDKSVPAWEDAPNQDDLDLRMAVYAAQIDRMDQGIGKIMAKVTEIGAEENTLFFFLADNGGCAEIIDRGMPGVPAGEADSFLSYGVGWANASNTPFRRYKHWVHEGGIASPLVVHWPAGIKRQGQLETQPGHVVDIMATCLAVAGVSYPKSRGGNEITPVAGISLVPAFDGKPLGRPEPIFWEHEGNRAVRDGKWKLVSQYPGDWELYDIEADRTELVNLAAKQPDVVKRMAEQYETWAARSNVVPWKDLPGAQGAKKKKQQ